MPLECIIDITQGLLISYSVELKIEDGALKDLVEELESRLVVTRISRWEKTIPKMLVIDGGTFQMGSDTGPDDEKPIITVTVDSFQMGHYEVTNQEYLAFLNTAGVTPQGKLNGITVIDMKDKDAPIQYTPLGFQFSGSSLVETTSSPAIEVPVP